MALDATRLKTGIITELTAQGFNTTSPYSDIEKMAEAIANAVIAEIIGFATCSGVDSNGDTHDAVVVV